MVDHLNLRHAAWFRGEAMQRVFIQPATSAGLDCIEEPEMLGGDQF